METRDIFICHASADKENYVFPFIKALNNSEITYWIDEAEITWGDNIAQKINEGLAKSKYVVVFLTPSFLGRNWPERELNNALSFETSTGKKVVLPILIASEQEVFRKYPLLRDKQYLKWENNIDVIVSNLKFILERDKNLYIGYETQIEKIEVNESLSINEIAYGEGSQIESVQKDDLLILDKEKKLPKEFVESEGRESYVIKSLFSERELKNLEINGKLHFPRNIKITGRRSQVGTIVAAYICTDIFYFQNYDYDLMDEDFQVDSLFGRGGISDFVDRYGNFQNKNKFIMGNGLGAVGALVVVEFKGKMPICRSKYVILLRAGIRYPDDIWRSKKTNKPITSIKDNNDISGARFIFQSRQPNGSGTDIFVADFNGENMYNLTQKNEVAYDGFYDDEGNEVTKWNDDGLIQYCSMTKGRREIKQKIDPLRESKVF